MPKGKRDPALADRSDAELAADLRQLWQEKTKAQKELERRGYEVNCWSYTNDTTQVEINKVSKSVL